VAEDCPSGEIVAARNETFHAVDCTMERARRVHALFGSSCGVVLESLIAEWTSAEE
jgi:hypothetical protein